MEHPETHQVTQTYGPRPAGDPCECFYCHAPVGGVHAHDCVMRIRTVVLEVKIQIVSTVPAFWDKENIEFHRNYSAWCLDNLLSELSTLSEDHCLCEVAQVRYVKEASDEDEALWDLMVLEED